MQRLLVSASASSDEADIAGVARAWADDATLEELAHSDRRFASLDFKLSTAAIECIRSNQSAKLLAQTVHSHESKAVLAGRCLKGRQVIYLMDQFFRTQPHMLPSPDGCTGRDPQLIQKNTPQQIQIIQ